LQDRIVSLTDDIRRICRELHPAVLVHAGLVAGLRAYCAQFSADAGIEILVNVGDEPIAVPEPVAFWLYRVTHEILHNVAQHSGSRKARVGLRRDGRFVELSIRDDGVGFDPATVSAATQGLGLISIEERLRLVRGTVDIVAAPGEGVQITARAPLDPRL